MNSDEWKKILQPVADAKQKLSDGVDISWALYSNPWNNPLDPLTFQKEMDMVSYKEQEEYQILQTLQTVSSFTSVKLDEKKHFRVQWMLPGTSWWDWKDVIHHPALCYRKDPTAHILPFYQIYHVLEHLCEGNVLCSKLLDAIPREPRNTFIKNIRCEMNHPWPIQSIHISRCTYNHRKSPNEQTIFAKKVAFRQDPGSLMFTIDEVISITSTEQLSFPQLTVTMDGSNIQEWKILPTWIMTFEVCQ